MAAGKGLRQISSEYHRKAGLASVRSGKNKGNVYEKLDAIVIDEISGMMLSLVGLPFNPISAAAGFVIFRLLDIFKPFPIRSVEKKFSGGTGIVLDDLAAGVITNIILRAAFFLSDTNQDFSFYKRFL